MARLTTAGCRRFDRAPLAGAVLGLLLFAAGPARAQAVPNDAELFQARVNEGVRMIERDPRLKQMTHQQLQGAAEFTAGNVLHVMLHEIGHALIDDMYLYVLGREEDAADSYATVAMLKVGGSFSERVLSEATKGWFYADRREQAQGGMMEFYDAHGTSQQRAYQIVCLTVGSDPDRFKSLADETKLPDDRQGTCMGDYNTASWGWDHALQPHRRAPGDPKTEIKVSYGDAPQTDNLDIYAKFLRSIRLLETVAEHESELYKWSAPLTLRAESCGQSDAHWNHPTRTLVLCYEMAAEFCHLYRDYSDEWKLSARVADRSGRARR
jgi:hypothetical protein